MNISVLSNKCPSQCISCNSSLNFMGIKFRMGCSLSMGFTEFKFYRIFIPKFSKTVWRSTAEYFLLGDGDSDIIITNTIIYLFIYLFIYFKFSVYLCLLVIRWQSCDKSRTQQDIKAIHSSILWMMCAVPISVIYCSSLADGWPGSNWRFWSNPFLIVPNAAIITGAIFILTFHILLTSISRSVYLLSFSC